MKVNENTIPLKIGLPSIHSRLHPKVMDVLGLPSRVDSKRLVFYSPSLVLFFLRPWDLPSMVETGYLDVAFCGIDTVREREVEVTVIERFQHKKSRIAFCKRTDMDLKRQERITVATEYPNITRKYLEGKYTDVSVLHIKGAAEAYPHIGEISAIVDVVETGDTLKGNNLELVDEIMDTFPCLIAGKSCAQSGEILNTAYLLHQVKEALAIDRNQSYDSNKNNDNNDNDDNDDNDDSDGNDGNDGIT